MSFYETNSGIKWLNVLQGTNTANILSWWDGVKWFKHGGWSMAGTAGWRGGLHNVLTLLLTMRDEDAFGDGNDWIHMLGVCQPPDGHPNSPTYGRLILPHLN